MVGVERGVVGCSCPPPSTQNRVLLAVTKMFVANVPERLPFRESKGGRIY